MRLTAAGEGQKSAYNLTGNTEVIAAVEFLTWPGGPRNKSVVFWLRNVVVVALKARDLMVSSVARSTDDCTKCGNPADGCLQTDRSRRGVRNEVGHAKYYVAEVKGKRCQIVGRFGNRLCTD